MKFNTLEDAERNCNAMAEEIYTLLGIQAGQTVLLSALIATHPDYDHLRMQIATALEVFDAGSLGRALSEKQRRVARHYVEELQRIQPAKRRSGPLG